MKQLPLLLFLFSAFASSASAATTTNSHNACLNAADYAGCMQVQTHGVAPPASDELSKLRGAMKQVASRLASGTSLRDSSLVFQPVIDAHAVVPPEQHNTLAYQAADMAIDLFDDTQSIWQARISGITCTSYGCSQLASACDSYNARVKYAAAKTGNPNAFRWNYKTGGWFGCRFGSNPEVPVYRYTIGVLRNGATDPQEIADYTARLADAKRLAALGPWKRYLERNPGMAAWAKANPTLAENKRVAYIKKHGSDRVNMPALPSHLSYLKGTRVERFL